MQYPSRAVVNLAAIRSNVTELRSRTAAQVMAVIKADAYGHGAEQVAAAAVEAGVTWLGIAQTAEAMALRELLPPVRVLSWLYSPWTDVRPAIAAGMDLGVSSPWAIEHVADAAASAGCAANVHLEVDTGIARGGVRPEEWSAFVRRALQRPELRVVGLWSHLARADEPVDTTARQVDLFADAVAAARRLGADPEVCHLAASGGTLWHPDSHFDLVRPGVSVYGMAPDGTDAAAHGLTPAMRLEAELVAVKRVPAGTPVSYGHTERVAEDTVLGTVPLGYADGIPRQVSGNGAWVSVNGRRCRVIGRVCMDQFVVDLGPDSPARPGDTAVVWGPGGPSVEEWARAAATINYTITTQTGARVPRVHTEEP